MDGERIGWALDTYVLEDKYLRESGRVFLSGVEALVRLPMLQRQKDKAAGLNTGGFVSGYRGSPLGGYDNALWKARQLLADNGVVFHPGLNEELAATAVWGSQQLDLYPAGATVDGVNAIWYGKAPGVDRAMDPLKHGNMAGCAKNGGVLVVAGDDHACQSSSIANSSDLNFIAACIPILQPASVQDILDFGLQGFALSRFASIYVGLKLVVDTVESTGSVEMTPGRPAVQTPEDFDPPPEGLSIRWPDAFLEQERRLFGPKLDAVAAFARTNRFDKVVIDSPKARLGIVAAGKSYLDVRQAMADLGIDDTTAEGLGIRLYKLGLTWPIETTGALAFAEGLEEILIIEEKRGSIEEQFASLLYNVPGSRPRLFGKADELGRRLVPAHGEIDSGFVSHLLIGRLEKLGMMVDAFKPRLPNPAAAPLPDLTRAAYFCSGCPHNSSTKVPEGSRAMSGIGCHGMVMWMPERNTGPVSQMGGEGMHWVGQAPFTTEQHVFQNLGDGTYSHSGLLAIRAAAAAGVNITYKILYNDAVAMTGGQPVEGQLSVAQVTHQVKAEGARRIAIVTDEPDNYRGAVGLAAGVTVHHRDELEAIQREMRGTSGLTILIYDQTCAAEKRRRRKRGLLADPDRRIFINDLVCEGCGDCQVASNCISVQPVETEFGTKRRIDQSSCNKDFSCVSGFCPSFVSVTGGRLRKAKAADDRDPAAGLPMPVIKLDKQFSILITGIGGTGVITIGHVLGMAAHLEGRGVSVLDNTGMAQKNGAVMSHVQLAPTPDALHGVRVAKEQADLILGCDMVTTVGAPAMAVMSKGATWAVVNADVAPVATGLTRPDFDLNVAGMRMKLKRALGEAGVDFVRSGDIATRLLGDSIASNMFMLGYAFQKGFIPLSLASIDRAIELNGVALDSNRRALAWGRLAAVDPKAVLAAAQLEPGEAQPETFEALVQRRAEFLTAYQDAAYAQRYTDFANHVRQAELTGAPGMSGLADTVAKALFKLMAYKDEYEVGRLYSDGAFRKKLSAQFDGDFRLNFHMAPPVVAKKDPVTGMPLKRVFGAWMMPTFGLLARLKILRGTAFDLFGRTAERRQERQDIVEYMELMRLLLETLTSANHAIAVKLAALPLSLRGYGHVKDANRVRMHETRREQLAAFYQASVSAAA